MKKLILIYFLISLFLIPSGFIFSQDKPLELKYPEIFGYQPTAITTPIPEYVRYIFNFSIAICGIIAFGVLVFAGARYLTSFGDPQKLKDGRDQIFAALSGLIILFASYLILTNINPELKIIRLQPIIPYFSRLPSGVLLCKERVDIKQGWKMQNNVDILYYQLQNIKDLESPEAKAKIDELTEIYKNTLVPIFKDISEKCYSVRGAENLKDFDNKAEWVYFIPLVTERGNHIIKKAEEYGAILYEDEEFQGKSEAFYFHLLPGRTIDPLEEKINISKPSSVQPFKLLTGPDPNWKAVVYEEVGFNIGFAEKNEQTFQLGGNEYYHDFPLTFSPKSIKITGYLMAVLFHKDKDTSVVFFAPGDSDLTNNEEIINREWCAEGGIEDLFRCAVPAANLLLLLSTQLY